MLEQALVRRSAAGRSVDFILYGFRLRGRPRSYFEQIVRQNWQSRPDVAAVALKIVASDPGLATNRLLDSLDQVGYFSSSKLAGVVFHARGMEEQRLYGQAMTFSQRIDFHIRGFSNFLIEAEEEPFPRTARVYYNQFLDAGETWSREQLAYAFRQDPVRTRAAVDSSLALYWDELFLRRFVDTMLAHVNDVPLLFEEMKTFAQPTLPPPSPTDLTHFSVSFACATATTSPDTLEARLDYTFNTDLVVAPDEPPAPGDTLHPEGFGVAIGASNRIVRLAASDEVLDGPQIVDFGPRVPEPPGEEGNPHMGRLFPRHRGRRTCSRCATGWGRRWRGG